METLDIPTGSSSNFSFYVRRTILHAEINSCNRYLILPSTFDSDPQLRFGTSVLAIIIVALLTGGYSLTALLWFACPSLLFRLDSVFIPNFAGSVFAFLAVMYSIASSPRYSLSQAMGPTTLGMAAASAILYGLLALIAQRKIRRMGNQPNYSMYNRSAAGTPSSSLWQEPNYYHNFVQNMHPTAIRSPASFDAPLTALPVSEEELVNQQMAGLLRKTDPGPSPDASQATFRLEWPQGEEDEFDAFGRRRQRTFSASGRLLAPGGPSPMHGARTRSESVQEPRSGVWAMIRGRPESRSGPASQARAKSRDERRREIELGQIS
jgi:hypothetical protein